ncbi:MAG: TRAP transporter small permease [Burkholderiaceae bacterium]|nr:TRAP transporter small permease [Burkholderiaceae bacterium]
MQDRMDPFGHLLERLDRLLKPIEWLMNLIGGMLVFALMFLGLAQIVLRGVFRAPMFGYIDIVELTMIGFAIFGIAYVQRDGGHVRMDMFVARLHGRALWVAELVGTVVAIAIVGILIPYSYQHFERAFDIGDSTIDIELPTWPAKLAVPVSLSVLMLRLIIQLLGYLRLIVSPQATPVAVPTLKSVEELAEAEIEGAHE